MRILLILTLSAIVILTSAQAQIKTYDVKHTPMTKDDPTGYALLYQISPTRTFAFTGSLDGHPFIVALNNEGKVEKQWKSTFYGGSSGVFYSYDRTSNTLVFLNTELIEPSLMGARTRLVLLDSNLTVKKNIVLDSTEYSANYMSYAGMRLFDSTIIWMSYDYPETKGIMQRIWRISKDGETITKDTIIDTNSYTTYRPMFQITPNKILFLRSIYNPKTKKYFSSFASSDNAFHFSPDTLLNNLYNDDIIPTRDEGIVVGKFKEYRNALITKYDKNFKEEWSVLIPAAAGSARELHLVEARSGGVYIAASAFDTTVAVKYPKYKEIPDCFQDICLSYIDTSGILRFSSYYGSEICYEDPYSIIQDYTDGGIVIAGDYGRWSWDPSCESLCKDNYTAWLFKVDSLGEPSKTKVITSVTDHTEYTNDIQIFPNPSDGILTVQFLLSNTNTIEITDIRGRILQSIPIEKNTTVKQIDISSFSDGNYFCRLITPSGVITRSFIIKK